VVQREPPCARTDAVGREAKGMIKIRESALVALAPPGGGVPVTTDQLDQAKAYDQCGQRRAGDAAPSGSSAAQARRAGQGAWFGWSRVGRCVTSRDAGHERGLAVCIDAARTPDPDRGAHRAAEQAERRATS
jgi:hypothetical protein